MNDFEDNRRDIDWSRYESDQRAQVPTTDRMPPPPPRDNSETGSQSDE